MTLSSVLVDAHHAPAVWQLIEFNLYLRFVVIVDTTCMHASASI